MRQPTLNSTLTALTGAGLIFAATTTTSLAHNVSVEFDDHTHYTDRYETARPNRGEHVSRYGSHRPGYVHFSEAAHRLEESSDRFRDRVRDLRRNHHGRRAHALADESKRFENLADTLRDIARDDRRHRNNRGSLVRELRDSGSRIDYLVSAYVQQPQLLRSWRRVRTHLGGVFETLRVGSRHDYNGHSYNHYGNSYAPFFPYRFDGGYNEGGGSGYEYSGKGKHQGKGKKHNARTPARESRPHARRGVVWASDQVEDASERTKNAYRHHIHAARIANHGWAKKLNGEFSAFDQAANRLRSSVQSNGRAPRAIYNELQNRRARIDSLMHGRPVGPTTRQHWSTVVNALGSLGNTY